MCLGFNVMSRQHELAARARSPSQQELPARADTSSQHELATRALSTNQLVSRHKRARARNQARPTLRSPCAALRPSPSPQDGRWRPCRIERKFSPVHARRQREQQPSCTSRGTTALLIKPQFASHGSLLIYWPRSIPFTSVFISLMALRAGSWEDIAMATARRISFSTPYVYSRVA